MDWKDALRLNVNCATQEAGASVLRKAGVANPERVALEVYGVMEDTRLSNPNERVIAEGPTTFMTINDNEVALIYVGKPPEGMPRDLDY